MAGPSLCSQRGLPLLSPRIEESRWTHLPARRPLPLSLMLHLFTDRTSLGYSFLLFFSFSRCWGSSLGFFSADSWVRAAVAADGGWVGRATAGARGAGGRSGGGGCVRWRRWRGWRIRRFWRRIVWRRRRERKLVRCAQHRGARIHGPK